MYEYEVQANKIELLNSIQRKDIRFWKEWHKGVSLRPPDLSDEVELNAYMQLLDDVACTCSAIWPVEMSSNAIEAYAKLSAITLLHNLNDFSNPYFKDGYLVVGLAEYLHRKGGWAKSLFENNKIQTMLSKYCDALLEYSMDIESFRISLLLHVIGVDKEGDRVSDSRFADYKMTCEEQNVWKNFN